MNPYPIYKPSGIDWLGDIPEHWELKRVKDLGEYQSGYFIDAAEFDDENKYPVYGGNGLRGFACKYNHNGKYILIGRQGALCGNINYVSGKFWATEHAVVVYNKSTINRNWYSYILEVMNLNQYAVSAAQPGLSVEKVRRLMLPYLEYTEQSAIANYLNSQTSSIDRKIELLTSKANKYKALRRSLINETVCRGLNPDAPLKDSGVEWIGMIPEHWEVKRFKDIAYSITGLTYSPDDIVDEDDGVLVLRSGNIQKGELSFNDNVFVNTNIGKNLFVRKGDILLCSRNGSANLVGKSAYIDKNYNYSWGAFMTVARSKMGRFLFYALNSDLFKRNMGLFQTSTVNQLTTKMLDNMAFLVPPNKEQTEIVNYLDTQTIQIDNINSNIEQQIKKLTQLRKSLINDVVTGKIKVTED